MKKITSIMIACIILSGCAGQRQWHKDGANRRDFYEDQGQCKAQAFSTANVSMLQAAIVINSCMQGKGWYVQ